MRKLIRQITSDEIAAYNVAGVVLLRDVLDLRAINGLRRCIDQAIEALQDSPSGYDLSILTKAAEQRNASALSNQNAGQYDMTSFADYIIESGQRLLLDDTSDAKGSFFLDTGVSARIRAFYEFSTRGILPEIAGVLLGSERVTFYGDQIFVKEPRTRERTAFHQDAPYFDIEGEQCCVMWVPVDAVTSQTGGMQYVRGSHRKGLYAPNMFVSQVRMPGSEGEDLPDIESQMDDYDIIQFDVEPGDVLVHHYKTWHGTGGNLSRYQVRRAASLRYCGDDIRVKARPGTPRQMHRTAELQDGDRLSGLDFPIVWTRKQSNKAA